MADEEHSMSEIKVSRDTFDEVMVPVFSPASFVPEKAAARACGIPKEKTTSTSRAA